MSPLEFFTSPAVLQTLATCLRWGVALYIGVKVGEALRGYL